MNRIEQKLYENFLFEKIINDAAENNINLNEEDVKLAVSGQQIIYDDNTAHEFDEYLTDFNQQLMTDNEVILK